MRISIFISVLMLLVACILGCAAQQSNYPGITQYESGSSGSAYQSQSQSLPPLAGYEGQVKQERSDASRKAAGEWLPSLMELQNTMINK